MIHASEYSVATAHAIARRIAGQHASEFGGVRAEAKSAASARLTWAMIDRGVAPHRGGMIEFDRLPGAPLLGFITAASASMLLWGAAVMITLRLV